MKKEKSSDQEIMKRIAEKTDKIFKLITAYKINYEYLFDVIINTNNYERQIISFQYKIKYNKSIFDEIDQHLDKSVKEIVKYMFYNPYELDARLLNHALKVKKDEKCIVEIFASRPHWYLQVVNNEYLRLYGESLKDELSKDKEPLAKFCLAIINTPRRSSQSIKTYKDAEKEVLEINKNGLDAYGKDVNLFRDLFVKKSREDLILIARVYKEKGKVKKNLYDAVDSKCPSKTRELLKAIIFATSIPAHYFASLLKKAIVGIGTDEALMNRVLVTRAEVDMEHIRCYYKLETKRELLEDIAGDTSGVYKTITMMLGDHD